MTPHQEALPNDNECRNKDINIQVREDKKQQVWDTHQQSKSLIQQIFMELLRQDTVQNYT